MLPASSAAFATSISGSGKRFLTSFSVSTLSFIVEIFSNSSFLSCLSIKKISKAKASIPCSFAAKIEGICFSLLQGHLPVTCKLFASMSKVAISLLVSIFPLFKNLRSRSLFSSPSPSPNKVKRMKTTATLKEIII